MSAAEAMRRTRLPPGIRWMGGSIIDKDENGMIVAHGILTNDPRGRERRVFAEVACASPEEIDNAIAYALAHIEAEAHQ
jgi:hypothetical protein